MNNLSTADTQIIIANLRAIEIQAEKTAAALDKVVRLAKEAEEGEIYD